VLLLAAAVVVLDVGGRLLLDKIGIVDLAEATADVRRLGRFVLGLRVCERIGLDGLFGPIGLRNVSGRGVRAGKSHGGSLTVTSVIKVWLLTICLAEIIRLHGPASHA
jgi:hypothetical protein